eukprot:2832480-Rhodomonas_salina.1
MCVSCGSTHYLCIDDGDDDDDNDDIQWQCTLGGGFEYQQQLRQHGLDPTNSAAPEPPLSVISAPSPFSAAIRSRPLQPGTRYNALSVPHITLQLFELTFDCKFTRKSRFLYLELFLHLLALPPELCVLGLGHVRGGDVHGIAAHLKRQLEGSRASAVSLRVKDETERLKGRTQIACQRREGCGVALAASERFGTAVGSEYPGKRHCGNRSTTQEIRAVGLGKETCAVWAECRR